MPSKLIGEIESTGRKWKTKPSEKFLVNRGLESPLKPIEIIGEYGKAVKVKYTIVDGISRLECLFGVKMPETSVKVWGL